MYVFKYMTVSIQSPLSEPVSFHTNPGNGRFRNRGKAFCSVSPKSDGVSPRALIHVGDTLSHNDT